MVIFCHLKDQVFVTLPRGLKRIQESPSVLVKLDCRCGITGCHVASIVCYRIERSRQVPPFAPCPTPWILRPGVASRRNRSSNPKRTGAWLPSFERRSSLPPRSLRSVASGEVHTFQKVPCPVRPVHPRTQSHRERCRTAGLAQSLSSQRLHTSRPPGCPPTGHGLD